MKITKQDILNRLIIVKTIDDFDGNKSIGFMDVGNIGNHYLMMYYDDSDSVVGHEHIGIGFHMVEKDVFLCIYSNTKELGLEVGDKMRFLFENGYVLDFKFTKRPIGKHPLNNEFKLTIQELLKFYDSPLKKWLYNSRQFSITADNSMICQISDVPDRETFQALIIKMATLISSELLEVQHPFDDV